LKSLRDDLRDDQRDEQAKEEGGTREIAPVERHGDSVAASLAKRRREDLDDPETESDVGNLSEFNGSGALAPAISAASATAHMPIPAEPPAKPAAKDSGTSKAAPSAGATAQQQAALNQLMVKYAHDQSSGADPRIIAALGKQIMPAAKALNQHVTLPRAPAGASANAAPNSTRWMPSSRPGTEPMNVANVSATGRLQHLAGWPVAT
jgi:hypothetical protein